MAKKKTSKPKPAPKKARRTVLWVATKTKAEIKREKQAAKAREQKNAKRRAKYARDKAVNAVGPKASKNFKIRIEALTKAFNRKYGKLKSSERKKDAEHEFKLLLKKLQKKETKGAKALTVEEYNRLNKILNDLDIPELDFGQIYGSDPL